jgi:hypothetical protein
MHDSKLRARLGLIGLFVLIALGVAALMAVMPAGAVTTGDAYPGFGDWNVNNATKVIDEEIIVYGDLNVNSTLELWNATIRMDLGFDNQYKVNVTTLGNLKANDTLITSTRTYREFGFQVHGLMTLKRVTVDETYGGVQVLTSNTVLIEDSNFLRSYGTGLYLEDADGTTIRNVFIQTNDLRVTGSVSITSYSYEDYQQYHSVMGDGGALYVKGGNPTIDGVEVSANGTADISVTVTKYYYYVYVYLSVFFPVVGIDSDEMSTIEGISVRDSEVDIRVRWYLYNNYNGGYWYLYTYGYATGVNVLNYGDVELKDCTATNVDVDQITHSRYHYGSYYWGAYTYSYNRGATLFGATVNKMFTTAGPHSFELTLKDASFEDVGVLTTAFTPDYNGSIEPVFRTKITIENVNINKGSYPFTFNVGPVFEDAKTIYQDILIKGCFFTNMTGPVYQNTVNPGPGVNPNVRTFETHDTVRFEDCTFRWCRTNWEGLINTPYERRQEFNNEYDRHIEISNCKFLDNREALFGISGNYYKNRGMEWFTLENCLLQNNSGSDFGHLEYRERLYIMNNTFKDVQYSYECWIYEPGGDHNGKQLANMVFHNNTFIDSWAGSGDGGMFYFDWGGTLTVSNNTISGMESNFISMDPWPYYAGESTFYFTGNEWTNCNGTMIYMWLYYQYAPDVTIFIEDNYGHDSNGWVTDFYSYYADRYEGDPTIYIKNNTMEGFTDKVFYIYGKVTFTGNTFKNCVGYVLHQDYISQNPPVIHSNIIVDCQDVYYLGAKDKGVLKLSLSVSDLSVDCTGNAFYFKRLDATMTNVTITNRCLVAIIADESNVDAMGCTVPIGSGEIIGNGEINVWFELELWVDWANAAEPNVSSGIPVEDALVVLYGSSSAYYTSAYTNEEGHLRTINIPQWSLKGSFLSVWSPYTITVTKSGITQSQPLVLDMDYSGEDAIHMTLVDTMIPVIRITSPFAGDLFNSEELMMRGFSTEIGSGIGSIWVAIGDGEWAEVEVTDDGDFSFTFSDLPEGSDLAIKAKVYDVATNMNETMILITIDRTPPRLVIFEPEDGVTVNEADIVIRGEYEPGATITINGLEREGTSGTLSEAYTLSEGNNAIVVVATDEAGNSAMETRTLRLDRFSPTLTVLAPRDGLVTRVTNITVEGDVELGSMATISIYRTAVDTIDEVITARPDGTFMHKIDLEEGENVIVVTAVDSADNPTQVTRVVFVDTTAPIVQITSPEEGTVTSDNTIRVTGTAEVEGITLYLNGKQIFNDGTVDRYVNLNEGTNVITLRANDLIGNEYEDSVTVYLDTTAPVIEPLRPRAQYLMTNTDDLIVQALVMENRDIDSITVMGSDVSWSPVSGEENVYTFET